MSKVKQRRVLTGGRNTSRTKAPAKPAPKGGRKAVKTVAKAAGRKAVKPATRPAAKKAASRPARPDAAARYAIKELDPVRKCGPGTSVQFLYRVDETVEGKTTAHLVFFDHHGWYCEHGRTCPAVAPAKKHNGHIARVS